MRRIAPGSAPASPEVPTSLREVYADLSGERPLDLREPTAPWEERHAHGKALRSRTPRKSHAIWRSPSDRPDPLETLARSNEGRLADLVPLRMGRMVASRFGFLRGSAAIMATDLARTPVSGIQVLLDGDAHLSNFGLFGTIERDVVFDLNDFDEAIVGPWEWDVKRLSTSVEVAGRDLGLPPASRREAVRECLRGYQWEIRRLEPMGALAVWYMFLFTARKGSDIPLDSRTRAIVEEAGAKAGRRTSAALLGQVAERRRDGTWRLRRMPPVQTPVPVSTRRKVLDALDRYAYSLPRDRRYLLSRYHVVDVARHVVGVGSVGTRVYLALLFGNGEDDPLFLQVKEGTVPSASPFVRALPNEFVDNQGKRVVIAQMGLNSSPDILLGWTRIDDRSYYVRQMRNMKGAVPLERLGGGAFPRYARACGAVLARAHARSGDAAMIAGYWGASSAMEEALIRFSKAYADQVERDHARLAEAVAHGQVKVTRES
jgi:uncharacterized protein (DUF2252 family)